MLRRYTTCLVFLLVYMNLRPGVAEAKVEPTVASLNPNASQLFLATMDLGDQRWDRTSSLLRDKPDSNPQVRESASYALGLLLRNGSGDNARAAKIITAVLAQQYNQPSMPFDGTFRRNLWEPNAPPNAVIWKDYDPNWREFVGTTFMIILEEFPNRLPSGLASKMDESIVHAIAGEIKNARLVPTYTNPALMFGILWDFAAKRSHRTDWIAQSADWQETVYNLFKKNGTFNEYNSPTYSGVDLYALSLWRRYGATARTQTIGSDMEAALWRDLASFYNANLGNISGPFDRAYGMDMESYVSVVGVALRTVLDAHTAPLPPLDPVVDPTTDHLGDIWFSPYFAILGVVIPPDAMKNFRGFQGDRTVTRRITDQRIATAVIDKQVMFGGESTQKTNDISGESQFHPATVQWRTPSGKIGWIQLTQAPPVDVTVDETGLIISCIGKVRFRIHAEGIVVADISQTTWVLPGLTVHVKADTTKFSLEPGTQSVDVEYFGITGLRINIPSTEK
jgi:hypothetical protein